VCLLLEKGKKKSEVTKAAATYAALVSSHARGGKNLFWKKGGFWEKK